MERLEKNKIKKVINRGYVKQVSPELILSLMHFFSASKGNIDIRMVYDGSKSGLNAVGLQPSPNASVQGSLRAKQMVLGDHEDKENPYHWEWIQKTCQVTKITIRLCRGLPK
jgi:hypothetical protein